MPYRLIDRRVRSLRVRAATEDQARRASALIDTALRTAAIPGTTGARVIVLKRLDVGAIPRAAAPARVALAIGAAVDRLALEAVHAASSDAERASLVYFCDEVEPLVMLAERLSNGRSTSEWFWPLAVHGWSPSLAPGDAAMLLVDRAMESPAGACAAARVIATLMLHGGIDALLETLSESNGRALLANAQLRELALRSDRPSTPTMPGYARSLIARWVARWNNNADDARAAWLTAMVSMAGR